MTALILGLAVLFGIHAIPFYRPLRARVVGHLGERAYKAAFALIALAGLAVAVFGMARAPTVALWNPPAWGRAAAVAAMLPAFILIAAANIDCRIKRRARHPMSLGLITWAAAHLAANGDAASVILFGAFGAFALLDIVRPRAPAVAETPATDTVTTVKPDAIAVVAGVAAYIAFAALHRVLFGVAVW